MPGDPADIWLLADATGTMEQLVRGLDALDASGLRDWTLIGGLAVMLRLSRPHRATRDIDALVRDADPEAKMVLLTVAARATPSGVVLADGTPIDVIDVASELDLDALPTETRIRMFALAHWWMGVTADEVHLRLIRRTPAGTEMVRDRWLRLARPAALVAAKLQSIPTRRGATLAKRQSDAYDVYRLLADDVDLTIAAELAGAPVDLGSWCADYLEKLFVSEVTRTAGWISQAAGDRVYAADVEVVGAVTVAALRHHLSGRALTAGDASKRADQRG